MLKIYDTNFEFLKLIDKCYEPSITTELDTGLQTLVFGLPLTDENLALAVEENYVETDDYIYVIKEVLLAQNDYIMIYCDANIEELQYTLVSVFDAFDINVESALQKAITNTGWTIEYHSNTQTAVKYQLAQTTAYELIRQIQKDYDLEIIFDTKHKVVKVYDYIGQNVGTYFSNELRLKLLNRQGQSYDYITVIYPIGKDGITIGTVNNGINLLENYQYSNKYKPIYWKQDDIEFMDQLKMAAQAYLDYYSMPIVSYNLELSALPQNTQIGDNIILVDKIKRTKQRQRIVKITKYPFAPERDKVELSNQIVNFADTFVKYNSDYQRQIKYIKNNLTTLE